MSEKTDQVIEQLKRLSLLEASELVKHDRPEQGRDRFIQETLTFLKASPRN